MKNCIKAIAAGLVLSASFSASATLYQYEDLNANNGGGLGDRLETIVTTYNSDSQLFTWDVTFNSNPTDVDGFWLVVDNGPNPKSSDVNELAIMYGDLVTGTLTTYVYNGLNSSNSWGTPGILLQTDTFTTTSDSLSIALDTTSINAWAAGNYSGISFDDNIGIWFHVSTGSSFGYDEKTITNYSYAAQGWYDIANRTTTQIPEPTSSMLMGLGLLALSYSRSRRIAK